MAKWRPIDVRLWNDRKFLALSDEGKLLWLYLLTCPETLSIPGVIVAGEAAIAERLEWLPQRFRERFAEVERCLLVHREGRLIWLPNALRYQPPSNPNAVKSWAKCWDDVPEGRLKMDVWQALKLACKSWSGLFSKGFPQPLHDGSGNGSANGYTQDQEQDQNQEQDQDQDLVTGSRPSPSEAFTLETPGSKAKRKGVKTRLPADWIPNVQHTAKAHDLGLDCARESEAFRDHHTAKASTFADWDAAFRTWLGNSLRFGGGTRRPFAKNNPTETSLAGLREAEARERAAQGDPFVDVPHPVEGAA